MESSFKAVRRPKSNRVPAIPALPSGPLMDKDPARHLTARDYKTLCLGTLEGLLEFYDSLISAIQITME